MRPLILINIVFVLSINRLSAQLADSLLAFEYRYFICTNDTLRQTILNQKINYCLRNNLTNPKIFEEQKRVRYNLLLNPAQKENFLWNAALVSYLNNQSDYSIHYISEYLKLTGDTTINAKLLQVLIYKYNDTALVSKLLGKLSNNDVRFKNLDCFKTLALYSRKHEKFYIISSLIVPGSGTAMNGAALKGLVSLVLTAGSVYGVYQLVQYGLYINAVMWGSGVGLKFYTGNVKLTQKTFEQKEAKQKNKLANNCELKLKELLNDYPLNLRGL